MKRSKKIPEIRDDEIRVIGSGPTSGKTRKKKWKRWWVWVVVAVVLILVGLIVAYLLALRSFRLEKEFEKQMHEEVVQGFYEQEILEDTVYSGPAYVEVEERTISDVPIRIFTPIGAEPSLIVGMPDFADTSIVFIAQAADIRADDMKILGDFVMKGEQIASGQSKWGWCAIIDGKVSIGYDQHPESLEEAISKGGYFFRQYGLIADGKYVKESSRWKYQSRRRALCLKDGECLIIETLEPETFPRFSYVLEDLQVDAAIYLVAGESYGFAMDSEGQKVEFGILDPKWILEHTSYIVWRKTTG